MNKLQFETKRLPTDGTSGVLADQKYMNKHVTPLFIYDGIQAIHVCQFFNSGFMCLDRLFGFV